MSSESLSRSRSSRKMSKITGSSTRVVAYLPSLRTFLHRLRATSKTPSTLGPTLLTVSPPIFSSSQSVNTAATTTTTTTTAITTVMLGQTTRQSSDHLTDALQYSREMSLLGLQPGLTLPGATGLVPPVETEDDITNLPESSRPPISNITDNSNVECCLQECPQFLHYELMQLFPGVTLSPGDLRVLTLCERTVNDMTGWSQVIEEEREQLLEHFIDSAKEICSRLIGEGYWADFIEPSSGRAFYGSYSPHTLFETDDKYRHLGFDIIDLGCCKCIAHPVWGSHTFVGAVFTNAPVNASPLQIILNL